MEYRIIDCLLLVELFNLVTSLRIVRHHRMIGKQLSKQRNQYPCEVSLTESDQPAGVPRIQEKSCACDRDTQQCTYRTKWTPTKQDDHPATDLVVFFYPYNSQEQAICFKLPNTTTTFTFTKHLGLSVGIEYYTFTVLALPIAYDLDQKLETMRCPEQLKINELTFKDIYAHDNVIFHCKFSGYPKPGEIVWSFNGRTSSNEILLQNSTHIMIIKSNSLSTITISNATLEHSGKYTCSIRNYFGSHDSKSGYLKVKKQPVSGKKCWNVGLLTLIGSACFVCFGVLIAVYRYICIASNNLYINNDHLMQNVFVYVSHCYKSEIDKEQLLRLLGLLQSNLPHMKIIVDLVEETAIYSAGGLAQWIPNMISQAQFIVIILSNSYLNALLMTENVDTTELTCKVLAEYNIITKMLYRRSIDIDKVILVFDGVTSQTIPHYFKGCVHHDIKCLYKNSVFLNRFYTADETKDQSVL